MDVSSAFRRWVLCGRERDNLLERVADLDRERDHANLVADSALRENKSLVDRVKRLEQAGDLLAEWHLAVVTTREKAERDVARWNEAKETKP